jgi:hypothetical protein
MVLTKEELSQYYNHPLHVAAALNNMSVTDFKKMYKSFGINRWPYNKYKNKYTSVGGFQDFHVEPFVHPPKHFQKKKIKKETESETLEKHEKIEITLPAVDLCSETTQKNNFEFDDEINDLMENHFGK